MATAAPAVVLTVDPPWVLAEFFTEEGLRAAQEYYFQTHATHSRLIAEGRNAQGISKSFVRRKLTREMGEDFKMYTGKSIGEEGGAGQESLGIRGELNDLLLHIYRRIAPGQPVTSPTQEDLTILTHPHGGLEVCIAMVFFYMSLLKKYASLASNRRKVLKSIMDEELFKWIWRTVIAYMMEPQERKLSLENPSLTIGLAYIPSELQSAPLGQKLHEIGMFLLSKTMQDSELRVAMCHYFSIYLRQVQAYLLMSIPRKEIDGLFKEITAVAEGGVIDHPLVAVDRLINGKGGSMDSFDDVLKDESRIAQLIPAKESEFINQFEDFGNPKRLSTTLRKLIPDPRKESEEDQSTALMPLLLLLRTMPHSISEILLSQLPMPILNLLRTRLVNASVDDVSKELVEMIRAFLDKRRGKGETYTLAAQTRADKAAVAASVRVAPAASPQKSPAEKSTGAPTGAPTGARTTPELPTAPVEDRPAGEAADTILDERTLLAWRVHEGRIEAVTMSAREVMSLTGNQLRFVLPWVVFTLRTGQVFGLAQEAISKETVETLVTDLREQFGTGGDGTLDRKKLAALASTVKGASMRNILLEMAKTAGMGNFKKIPPSMGEALERLAEKFGGNLENFLRNPGDGSFREFRTGLSAGEKQALTILNRVARAK